MKTKLQYSRNCEIIEVIIRDFSGARIESRKCPIADKKGINKIMRWLSDKYNFTPTIDKGINELEGDFLEI